MNRSLVLTAFLLTGAAPANENVGKRQRLVEVVFSTIFLKQASPPFTNAKIDKAVSKQTISTLPDTDGKFAMISLDCKKVSGAGKLSDCQIDFAPRTDALRAIGERARRDIVMNKNQLGVIGDNLKWVSIQLRVSNSIKPAIGGPCWPPSCHFVLPPPPLPASSEKQ